jgi:hypothetical protein
VPVTWNELGAKPDGASGAVTVATWISLPFGGQSAQPGGGIPEMTGGVWSILIVTETEFERPAPFVAEHVSVMPAVSVVTVLVPHPDDDAIPIQDR